MPLIVCMNNIVASLDHCNEEDHSQQSVVTNQYNDDGCEQQSSYK
jgi:hypothetical protein